MNRRIPIIVAALAVLAVVIWLAARPRSSDHELLLSGTIEATEARLGFGAPGRIEAILVQEGDSVKAGAELARLDRAETLAQREQAAAQVAAAQALLNEMERGARREELAQARAAREAARQRLEDAERDLARTRTLAEGGAVSRETLDKAVLARDLVQSQLTQADEQLRLVEKGPREERVEAQRAQLAQAQAALAAVDAVLEHMIVRAPFAGIVTTRHREPGEIVGAGSPAVTIVNPRDRWVRVFVPETAMAGVHLEAPARITADRDPKRVYPGEVSYIASEAEFTPKSVQTREERVKLVYAVKVQVTGDPAGDLKPGMPVDVVLELARR